MTARGRDAVAARAWAACSRARRSTPPSTRCSSGGARSSGCRRHVTPSSLRSASSSLASPSPARCGCDVRKRPAARRRLAVACSHGQDDEPTTSASTRCPPRSSTKFARAVATSRAVSIVSSRAKAMVSRCAAACATRARRGAHPLRLRAADRGGQPVPRDRRRSSRTPSVRRTAATRRVSAGVARQAAGAAQLRRAWPHPRRRRPRWQRPRQPSSRACSPIRPRCWCTAATSPTAATCSL